MLVDNEKYRVAYLAITELGTTAAKLAKQLQVGVVRQSQWDTAIDLTRMLNAIHLGFPEDVLTAPQESALYTNTEQLATKFTFPVAPSELNVNGDIYYNNPVDFFFTATISGTKIQELANYNIIVYRDPDNPSV